MVRIHGDDYQNPSISVRTQSVPVSPISVLPLTENRSINTNPIYGPTGNGIVDIVKTGTEGLIDTYTVYYTNGATSTFTVTNGQDGQDGYSLSYVHEQGEASDVWIIEHNLNKYPSVTVVDTAGTQFLTEVEYNDLNTVTVYMNGEIKGKAYLN